MFNKKILSGILSAALLASTVSVAAAGFSDVENDPTVAWAVPYINEMTQKGYIKATRTVPLNPTTPFQKPRPSFFFQE